jgi:hypothetical protein
MKTQDYQSLIEEIWPRLKKKHLYPEIPMPKVKDPFDSEQDGDGSGINEAVGLEMKQKQITLHSAFIMKMKGKMEEMKVIEALLDHGITHYTYCPWDFNTHLMFYAEAKKVVGDKELASRVANYFMDIIADTHCVNKRNTEIPELHRNLEKGRLEKVIASLYQIIWGIDLGISSPRMYSERDTETVRRLARIPYLKRSQWGESIQKFARFLKPLLVEDQKAQGAKSGKSQRAPQGDHDLNSYSPEEIDEGLRKYAKETMVLSDFKEIIEDFSIELKEAGYGMDCGMGRGKGRSIDADILFYMKMAENYSIPVKKILLEKKGKLHPYTHAPWEIGSPVQDVDVWTSFGKMMPGITQIWTKRVGRGRGKDETTPDCLIAIDSSGSMINPRKGISYAVLGAACAANAYLQNHSKVAVYNFSDAPMGGKDILNYTNRKENIYRTLCKYFGGGTALNLEDLIPLIQEREHLDLFLITDMKITNLEDFIGYFEKIQNRVTAVHIGDNPYSARFEKAFESKKNISIYTIKRKEDIPHIVLGRIRDYFNSDSLSK